MCVIQDWKVSYTLYVHCRYSPNGRDYWRNWSKVEWIVDEEEKVMAGIISQFAGSGVERDKKAFDWYTLCIGEYWISIRKLW